MLKKSRDEVATDILNAAQNFTIVAPEPWQAPDDYYRMLTANIQNWMHNVVMEIVNNIYTEQEMSDKVDGILLEKPHEES